MKYSAITSYFDETLSQLDYRIGKGSSCSRVAEKAHSILLSKVMFAVPKLAIQIEPRVVAISSFRGLNQHG